MFGQNAKTNQMVGTLVAMMAALVCLFAAPKAQAHVKGSKAKTAQAVQCTVGYTACVLSCNKLTVIQAKKAQDASSVKSKAKWQKALSGTQTTCIPECYRVNCLGGIANTKQTKKKATKVARK